MVQDGAVVSLGFRLSGLCWDAVGSMTLARGDWRADVICVRVCVCNIGSWRADTLPHTHTHTHTHTHETHATTHARMHAYIYAHMHTCMHACIHTCNNVHLHVCSVCMCACVCARVRACVHIRGAGTQGKSKSVDDDEEALNPKP
jgi:hypothetical protein